MKFQKQEQKYAKQNTGRKFSASALVSYLLIAVVLTTGVSFSRYQTTVSGGDGARVARYAFEVNEKSTKDDFSLTLDGLKAPGDSVDVIFVVTNKDEMGLCEVVQEYDITFTTTDNLPLLFTLEGVNTTNSGTIYSEYEAGKQMGVLPAAEEAVHTYTLKIEWPARETDPKYSHEIDRITIQINAQQAN